MAARFIAPIEVRIARGLHKLSRTMTDMVRASAEAADAFRKMEENFVRVVAG